MTHRDPERWWVMECSLPDYDWARLETTAGGGARVLDAHGGAHAFARLDEALTWLAEEEYIPLRDVDVAAVERFDDLGPGGRRT